jgi:hypothetical protein
MPSFSFRNATKVQVDSIESSNEEDAEDDDPDREDAAEKMLGLVKGLVHT